MFALTGRVDYDGVRLFVQNLLGGSPIIAPGTVTFVLNINFDTKQFCASACSFVVNTMAGGGNLNNVSTAITAANFGGRTGSAFGMITNSNILNSAFNGSRIDVFDFNDGTGNIVANNLSVDVRYDDGGGNKGSTPIPVPSNPGIFVP